MNKANQAKDFLTFLKVMGDHCGAFEDQSHNRLHKMMLEEKPDLFIGGTNIMMELCPGGVGIGRALGGG